MFHHIYKTEAFILSSKPSREADAVLALYTREFGLIYATAQGLRELKSKLRYSLQSYSLSVVSLVRGRAGWRVVNARLLTNYFAEFSDECPGTGGRSERRLVLARVYSLLRRMLAGEERNAMLFDSFTDGLAFLMTTADKDVSDTELVIVLRVLYYLGYIGKSPLSERMVKSPWGEEVLHEASRERRLLLQSVNESLHASHL